MEAVQIDLDGDVLLCDGGSTSERRLLQETDIIFNVLASVKFNETIRNALTTNVGGTRKVLQLAQRMTRLRSIVHISTLYSNCNREEIEEKIYDDLPLRQEVVLKVRVEKRKSYERDWFYFKCFLFTADINHDGA